MPFHRTISTTHSKIRVRNSNDTIEDISPTHFGDMNRQAQENELKDNTIEFAKAKSAFQEESKKLTPEYLDKVHKGLMHRWKKDWGYDEHYDHVFETKLLSHLFGILELFDDGKDLIILAKLGDQIPRMFEKMRDNVEQKANNKIKEQEILERKSLNDEITENQIDDCEEEVMRLRGQWSLLNHVFHLLLTQFRPKAIADSCMPNWGGYTELSKMPKVIRMAKKRRKMRLSRAINNPKAFSDDVEEIHGAVELPEDLL